jgi:hypothetical protein
LKKAHLQLRLERSNPAGYLHGPHAELAARCRQAPCCYYRKKNTNVIYLHRFTFSVKPVSLQTELASDGCIRIIKRSPFLQAFP